MTIETINHATLEQLIDAGAVRGATVVGVHGGWGVLGRYGMTERHWRPSTAIFALGVASMPLAAISVAWA